MFIKKFSLENSRNLICSTLTVYHYDESEKKLFSKLKPTILKFQTSPSRKSNVMLTVGKGKLANLSQSLIC